ncbi:hypothetical protein Q1695_005001 [Nippostrongylus brasiliensis]|nr:hypothetical protein Q1695_005001 [Nippostrongylus brasiliensis]
MLLPIFLAAFATFSTADRACAPRILKSSAKNIVCVCNATYCDDIEPVTDIPAGTAVVYSSSLSGRRFSKSTKQFSDGRGNSLVTVDVDTRKTFQTIIGFGGAITDSVGYNMNALNERTRYNLLLSYFGKNGLEYNLVRVPIASTDFSTREYSYDDVEGDLEMKNFALTEEDLRYKIPYITAAVKLTRGAVRLFASPWSAPGWMKTNGRMKGGGSLKGEGEEDYKSYARYLVKFFEEYAKKGVQFWGMTIQNEPSSGALPSYGWQTMFFTSTMQRDFMKVTLGPMLKGNDVTKNLKVMGLDDNRLFLPGWADKIFNDVEAAQYVDGIGVHWYLNFLTPPSVLATTHKRHPTKFILATEACTGSAVVHGPILGDWYRGEEYAADIITNLNNFVAGWTDWNMCLDLKGGPTWVGNYVDSPVIVNAAADEFYKQPMFYAMGHFSKFFKPGSVRISTTVAGPSQVLAAAVAFKGRTAMTLLNRLSSATTVSVNDVATGRHLDISMEPNSIVTLLWEQN